jgi:hypothetical protein
VTLLYLFIYLRKHNSDSREILYKIPIKLSKTMALVMFIKMRLNEPILKYINICLIP